MSECVCVCVCLITSYCAADRTIRNEAEQLLEEALAGQYVSKTCSVQCLPSTQGP